MAIAFECDLCKKFEAGTSCEIQVRRRIYDVCTDCLSKIDSLIAKIENQNSKEKKDG